MKLIEKYKEEKSWFGWPTATREWADFTITKEEARKLLDNPMFNYHGRLYHLLECSFKGESDVGDMSAERVFTVSKKHEVLHGQLNQHWLTLTTHPKVAYDHVGEKFVVDLGQGAYAEVYGLNRFQRAIQLADINWEEIE